ncbi:MAG: lipocalin family protein [Candidatus Melainabacteria bacterium]|nr:lipocalin family protein [Candidatus Melainabacteria bacterium]
MFKKIALFALISVAVVATVRPAIAKDKLLIVQNFDLSKYVGTWYEVARLPNWFERNCSSEITAQYSVREDGKLDVRNSCKKKSGSSDVAQGVGRFASENTKLGHLKVTFAPGVLRALPFVWADYCVIDVDADYRIALVGDPSRKYLWILSKDRDVDKSDIDRLMKLAAQQGFDVSKLINTEVGRAATQSKSERDDPQQ